MGHEAKKWTAIVVAVLIIVVTVVVAAVHNRDVELDSYWVRNPAKFCSGYSGYAVMDPARCYDFEEFYEDFVGAGGREAVAPSGTGRGAAQGGAEAGSTGAAPVGAQSANGHRAHGARVRSAAGADKANSTRSTQARQPAANSASGTQVRRPAANSASGEGASTTGIAMTGTWRDILRFVKIDVCSERDASEEAAGAAGYDEQWIARKDFIAEPLYCMANGDKVTVRITFDLDGLRAAYPGARKLSGENVVTKAYTIGGLKTPTVVDPFAMLARVSVDGDGNLVYTWKHNVVPCGNYFLKHADYTNFDLLDGNGKIVESNVVVFRAGSNAGAGSGAGDGSGTGAGSGTKADGDANSDSMHGAKGQRWKDGDRVRVTTGTTATHYLRDYGIVVQPVEKVFVVQK